MLPALEGGLLPLHGGDLLPLPAVDWICKPPHRNSETPAVSTLSPLLSISASSMYRGKTSLWLSSHVSCCPDCLHFITLPSAGCLLAVSPLRYSAIEDRQNGKLATVSTLFVPDNSVDAETGGHQE